MKSEGNVSGKYYVDQNCINCGLCAGSVEDVFALNDVSGMSYVHKQPEAESEIAECEEALSDCPVGAIGNDGDA